MKEAVSIELSLIFAGSTVREFRRGSTGLHRLFEVIRDLRGAGEIIVPALCCETVALAVRYAGHAIRFADVDTERFCVTPDSVAAQISPITRAVVLVHLYGLQIDLTSFIQIRKANPSIVFIEDVAHAAGGCVQGGQDLGSGLDYAMFSFSGSKVLGGSGGAIVSHQGDDIARTLAVRDFYNDEGSSSNSLLSLSLRNLVHSIADLHRAGSRNTAAEFLPALWDRFRPVVVQDGPFDNVPRAVSDLRQRAAIRVRRRARADLYRQAIVHPGFRIACFSPNETCWRLPVLADNAALALRATELLRFKGLHASNHYFPLNYLFGGECLPAARYVGDRMLNLWVDDSTTESHIAKTAEVINSL